MRILPVLAAFLTASPSFAADFPKFKTQEIDSGLKIGYAVITTDINGDKKPDIVVVDQHKVVWYENPTWKKRVILDGKTRPDNVCIAAVDIDGDGKIDLVLGAGWKPFDTANPGTLQWLKNPGAGEKEWEMFPIPCDEPMVHRLRIGDIDGGRGDGKLSVIVAPLMGRDATQKGNWLDGRPVRITAYVIPKDPKKKGSWKSEVLSEKLHVVHNFDIIFQNTSEPLLIGAIVTASYEGLNLLQYNSEGKLSHSPPISVGDQTNPKSNRGSSEVKAGWMKLTGNPRRQRVLATIEPWHGNQVVTYITPMDQSKIWDDRHVIDDHLRWGHAVWFADLDGDKSDELIIGVRDDPSAKAGDKFTERRGVRIYKCTDGKGAKWDRMMLDEGGVAVEDMCAADLNGDGKIDIIAVGRQTGNCRIYWNQGK